MCLILTKLANFVYIDESHFDFRAFNKHYGCFKKGERAQWSAGHVARKSYSLLMAQTSTDIFYHYVKNTEHEGVKKHDFLDFLEELALRITPNHILVMDNA